MPSLEKEIYLTFDDGPIPGPTEFVLDQLEKVNGRATFFCIGDNVSKHPDVFERVRRQGHAVGNHTFNHLKGWNCGVSEYVGNVQRCQAEFLKYSSGEERRLLFRPPYGRIKRRQIDALARDNYSIIMRDVLTHDYSATLSPNHCLRGSIRATRPGSIVVFHDSLKAEKNMRYTLPRFIEHFAGLGYSFKEIPNSLT